jgi:predicted DNA-binding ribbon-helix-helix protein
MSTVEKRSVSIRGHRTSYSLEKPFYDDLVAIAQSRKMTLAALVASIDAARPAGANLSSALRLYVLDWAKGTANRLDGEKTKNQADRASS